MKNKGENISWEHDIITSRKHLKSWLVYERKKYTSVTPLWRLIPATEWMDEMFRLAAKLSEGVPFLRVDLYQSSGRIYFGELTFFPDSGFDRNLLPETDDYFGAALILPLRKKK